MKKLVQRFALLALMLLPMLASATVTNAVPNYAARGSVQIGNAQGGAAYDTVFATPNTGYKVNKWLNGGTELAEIPGQIVFDGDKLLLDAAQDWDITCQFGTETYTVSVDPALEHGTITGDLGSWPYGKLINLTATPDGGYQFDSWADDPTATATRAAHVTGNIVLSATFVPATYDFTITTNADDITVQVKRSRGSETIFNNTYDLANGETIPTLDVAYEDKIAVRVFTAAVDPHYDVPTTWTQSNETPVSNSSLTYTILSFPAEATTLDIALTPATIAITAVSSDDELGTVSGGGDYGYGTPVTLTATPTGDQYEFVRWNDGTNDYTDNPLVFTASDPVTYTAYFDYKKYPITLASDPASAATFTVDGIDYDPTATYYYSSALSVEANATSTNYVFSQWSDGNTDNPRTVYVWNETSVNLTAEYTPNQYDVTFAANTALDLTGDATYSYGESVTVTATPKNADEYEFVEWQVNGTTVSTDADYTFTVDGDVTLDAIYQGVEYTITAVTNTGDESEGTVSPASQTVRFGETFSLSASPATGYEFKHWNEPTHYNDQAVVTDFDLDYSNAGHAYEWTASFGPKDYTVTVNDPDPAYGITLSHSGDNTVSYGSTITVTVTANTDPTKYEVVGWKDGSDNDITMPYTVTGDVTINAVIDGVSHNLTLTNATIAGDVTSLKYNTNFTLTPATIAGKSFKNWKVNGADGSNDANFEFTMTNADMEIEAVFQDEVYYVHATADPAGAATFTGTGDDFTYGATANVTAIIDEHYTFDGWDDSETTEAHSPITVTDDVDLVANCTPKTYNITVTVNDPVMGTAATSQATAEYNTYIFPFLSASPNPDGGYYLVEYRDQNDVVVDAGYQISEDVTITAVFGYSTLSVTAKVVENGNTANEQSTWGSIVTGGVLVYTGEVTLTATASPHYNFVSWSDGVTDNPRTFILTRDTIFYAYVAPDTHTVAITVNDENMGEVTGFTGTKAAYGSTIDVTAVANTAEHYHFDNWSDATTDAIHATITVDGDITLQANFSIDQVTITAANTDGFGTFTPATPSTVDYGETVELNATANHGYKFLNWSNGVTTVTENPYEVEATSDETWTVSFEIDQFTVTVAADPTYAAATLTGAGDYDYMTSVTVATTAATGYVFDHFEDNHGVTFVSMPFDLTDDTTVVAVFDSVTVSITAESNNDLWGTVTPSATSAKYNEPVTLTATPVAGYKLVSWNDGTNTYAALANDTTFTVPATDVTYTATFAAGEFEVAGVVATGQDAMGTVTGTATALYGETVTLTATANDGYSFVNWDNDPLLTDAAHAFAVGTENTTHTAYFEANTYTLTIATNFPVRGHVENAGATVTDMTVDFGDEVTLDAVSHTGYDFENWTTISGTTSTDNPLTFTYDVVGDATVTANFKYHEWTVTATGTNGATVTGSGTYSNGEEITLTATPAEHYTIWKGWKNENGDTVSMVNPLTVTVLSDSVLTALYDVDTHAIVFTILPDNTYGSITNGVDGDYAYGTEIELTAVPFDEHYSFVKWEDNSTDATRTITVEEDATYTATFEADKYQFTVASANTAWGNVTGDASGEYDYNTTITVGVTPATGYEFVKWVDALNNDAEVSTNADYSFAIDSNTSIKAVFDYQTFDITLNTPVKEMGYISVYDENDELIATDSVLFTVNGYKTHTDYTVVATPKYGYLFDHWTGDATGTDSLFTTSSDDATNVSYEAIFAYQQFDVTLSANDDNRGTVSGAGTYSYANIVNIAATPETGFHFLKWSDNNTENPRSLLVQGDTTLVAIFAYDPITVSADECDSVVWMNGEDTVGIYYNSEDVTVNFEDIYGLDSVVTNNITVRHSTTGIDVQTSCYTDYTWINGTTYSESNNTDEYLLTGANAEGCDSLVTLNFTYFENTSVEATVESCQPFTWSYTGLTYDTEGDFVTGPEADVNGCDSTTTLHLTFITPTDINDVVEACDTYTWQVPGEEDVVYTASTTTSKPYTDPVTNCSATAYLTLTIQETNVETLAAVTACDEYDWNVMGETLHFTDGGDKVYEYVDGVCEHNTITLPLTINYNTNTRFADEIACDELVYTWANDNVEETFTASGVDILHNYNTVEGCPSVDTVNVVINAHQDVDTTADVCDSFTWNRSGETYTTTGIYTTSIVDENGCDATATLDLTVRYKVNETVIAEACDSYEWNGLTFTESGNITINSNGGAANGCDSITTLQLTIQHTSNTVLDAVTVCDEYTWEFNSTIVDTYTTSGEKVYEYAEGLCEHNTATLPLTINTLADVEETAASCDTYTWTISSTSETFTYTEGGDKVETITDANGCAATATLHLTINDSPEIEETAEACTSYDWTIMGHEYNYTTSGDKVETFTDANSCTVTATLHLTIHTPAAGNNTAATICDGATYTWNEVAYNEAGTYYYDYADANNCAVQDTLVLTINTVVPGTNTAQAICEGATYTWNNNEYTEANTYYYDYTDANNCPVQDTLVLTVNVPEAGTNTAEAICDGATFTWNNNEYTEANTYYYDYTDANGCATQDTLVLTVNIPAAGTNTAETICEGTTYTWNNTEYTTANTYYYDYTDVNGCAVQDTLVLTVNTPVAPAAVEATACDTYTWTLNNQTYTTSGAYTAHTTDANGCAVNATLNLTVNQHQDSQESATACDTYTWAVNNTAYTASGAYTAAITDANGCAATATLNLTVNQHQDSQESATACDTYTWALNNTAYTTSGAYTAAITDVNGCAATATLNLTVNQSVTESIALSDTGSVVFNNETFTADTVVTVTFTAANGCDSTVTATITVIPVDEPDSLTIVIAINDATMGTTTPAPGTYYYHAGDTVSVSATAYEGYQFIGWEIAYEMFGYSLVDTIELSEYEAVIEDYYFYYGITNMNLTAIFEADSTPIVDTTYYTVALFSADTTMGTVSEGDSVMAGESFTATAYPVNGYNFVAWMNGADTASIENPYTFIVNADITLTAIFEADSTPIDTNHYTVTIAMGDDYQGCSVSPLGVFVVPADTVMTVTATDTMGLVFAAWLDENDDTVSYQNPYTFTVNSDVTLYAIFYMVPTYTISVIEPSNGTITPGAGENIEVNEGADVTFTAVPDSGYMFAYWTIDGSVDSAAGNPYTFYNVNANHVITATFEVDTTPVIDTNTYYYVTILNADTTMGTVAESDSVIAGYQFHAYAIAFDGYRFTAWTGVNDDTISIENPYIFVPTGDITLIANFEVDSTPVIDTVYYTITVNYDATMGTVTGDGRYVEGTLVTLRATANTGYRFLGWVKDNDTVARTNEYAFVLNADVTLTAAFEAIPVYYTVIGMPNDATMGEVLGSGEFVEGSTVTLTAQAFEGYRFDHWSTGATTPSLTITVTEDVTVIAYFVEDNPPQAIDETDMENVTIYSAETRIIVRGAEGKTVNVYDINGRTVSTQNAAAETVEFRMNATGVYLVKVGNAPAKRVLVVR